MHRTGLYRQGFDDALRGYNDPQMMEGKGKEQYVAGWADGLLSWNAFIQSTADHRPAPQPDIVSLESLCCDMQDPIFVPSGMPSPYRKRQQGPKSHTPLAVADLSDVERTTKWEHEPFPEH